MPTNSLALQLHSLRHEAANDPEGIVRRVPALGFDSVEIAETYGWSADHWKRILAETKLRVVGAHVRLETLESEWDAQTEFQQAIGCPRLVVPSLPKDLQTVGGLSEAAKRLTVLGNRAKSEGLALFYHNHAYEFSPLSDGRCGMDILLAETDPALLGLEVDTYWVERGGVNSRDFIQRNAARIGMLHAKEFCRDGRDVPAGQGDVDWKTIIPLAHSLGWPVIAEYEADNALAAVEASARYLRGL
ncbi:MAG: sugar phosphate isomerase/epimerase [Verrucomicrobiia bacterium]|jgi:sugar phosphate isomerase/epimerase